MRHAEQAARPIEGAGGLWIETVGGRRFRRRGPVRYHAGLGIYYCGGGSWPEEIVRGVWAEQREDEEKRGRQP